MGRPDTVVAVSAAEGEQLGAIERSRSLPHSLVRRARIVLMSAAGISNQTIAARCGVSVPTITHRAICRGSFRSVRDLVQKIDRFVTYYNTHKRPFAWTATAYSIFATLQRLRKVIYGTQHWGGVPNRC